MRQHPTVGSPHRKFVYAVDVPEDSGIDGLYSTPAKALARLREYGPVKGDRLVSRLRNGEIIYLDEDSSSVHAYRFAVQ